MPANSDHPALGLTIRAFEIQEGQGLDPIVAILGPPGTGKSDLLCAMLEHFASSTQAEAKWTPILIDLLKVPISSDEEMYASLLTQLLDNIHRNKLSITNRPAVTTNSGSALDKIVALLEGAAIAVRGRLLLAIDHLNYVPYEFAQEICQRLRGLKEASDRLPDLARIALTIAATSSLFKMATSEKSVFHSAKIVCLPLAEVDNGQAFITRILQRSGRVVNDEIVNLLYEETGADPAFLNLVMLHLDAAADISVAKKTIEQIDFDAIPDLRHMALHWFQCESLRDIISRLLDGHPVLSRSTVPDADEHQLTGAVIITRAKNGGYFFRNGIVKRFLLSLARNRLPRYLIELRTSRQDIRNAPDAQTCCLALNRAWHILTNHTTPTFQIVFYGHGGRRAYLKLPGTHAPSASMDAAVARSIRNHSAAFGVDGDSVSLAVPLSKRDATCWLVCTTTKSGEPFCEFAFQHWLTFVASVADTLEARGMEGILQHELAEPAKAQSPTLVPRKRLLNRLVFTDDNAVLVAPGKVQYFRGRFECKWAERANRKDFISDGITKKKFDETIEEVGEKVEAAIQRFQGLNEAFVKEPTSHDWIISSDIAGLKVPLELLHIQRTPLCLHTGIARQVLEYDPPEGLRQPLHELIEQLRISGKPLRVLVVGADPSGELPVDSEVDSVKRTIQQACAANGMSPPTVLELGSAHASSKALKNKLDEDGPYHFFHFCGHGFYTHIRLNNKGEGDDVPSDLLKEWLRGKGISLCYMSACHTCHIHEEGLLTSSSMTEHLLSAGIPNLVGFRWAVSMKNSLVMATAFYEHLLTPGCTLIGAMRHARSAARSTAEFTDAWASSIVITQIPGDRSL